MALKAIAEESGNIDIRIQALQKMKSEIDKRVHNDFNDFLEYLVVSDNNFEFRIYCLKMIRNVNPDKFLILLEYMITNIQDLNHLKSLKQLANSLISSEEKKNRITVLYEFKRSIIGLPPKKIDKLNQFIRNLNVYYKTTKRPTLHFPKSYHIPEIGTVILDINKKHEIFCKGLTADSYYNRKYKRYL